MNYEVEKYEFRLRLYYFSKKVINLLKHLIFMNNYQIQWWCGYF